MEFATTIQNNIVSFAEQHPQAGVNRTPPIPKLFAAKTDDAEISSLCIPGRGFTVWRTDYVFRREVTVGLRSPAPLLMLHFLFDDTLRISVNDMPYQVRDRQFNLSYFPSFNAITRAGKRATLRTVHIHLKPGFLLQIMNGTELLSEFLKLVKQERSTSLSALRHYPTPEMLSNIHDILHNPYRGNDARLFTSAQVNLLFLRAMNRITGDHQRENRIGLTAEDVEKLNKVREFIIAHKTETVSISHLARMAGINTDKLKKGFYQLFGTPVIAYHEYLRLDEARRLLTRTDMTVTEVAFALGYSSLSHFSKAFKRTFHASPVLFKKTK